MIIVHQFAVSVLQQHHKARIAAAAGAILEVQWRSGLHEVTSRFYFHCAETHPVVLLSEPERDGVVDVAAMRGMHFL